MAKIGTVKASTIASVPGKNWNPEFILKLKDRLDMKGVEETPDNVQEEVAIMSAEAMDRVAKAKQLQDEANQLETEARAERLVAEELTSETHASLSRKM